MELQTNKPQDLATTDQFQTVRFQALRGKAKQNNN